MIEKYAERLERNTNNALLANHKFLTMQEMRGLYSSHHEAFEWAEDFFSTALWSFLADLFITIPRMFESNYSHYGTEKKNFVETTVSLMEEISTDPTLPENKKHIFYLYENLTEHKFETEHTKYDILELLRLELQQENDTLEKFKKLRNKFYAHSDKVVAGMLDQFMESQSITFSDMERLLVLNMNICYCLQVIAEGSYPLPPMILPRGSLTHLLELVEQGMAFDDYIITHPEWAIKENLHITDFS